MKKETHISPFVFILFTVDNCITFYLPMKCYKSLDSKQIHKLVISLHAHAIKSAHSLL